MGVAAEAGEEFPAAFNGVQEMKSGNGAAGAVSLAIFERNHNCRALHAVDHPRGKNADDAAVPSSPSITMQRASLRSQYLP